MISKKSRKFFVAWIGIIAVFSLSITGCSVLQPDKKDSASHPTAKKPKGPAPLYYEFEDVLVPKELKLNKKSSFIVKTMGFKAGVLSFGGRVETSSLIAFFENNMANDNWEIVSSLQSPRTILLFKKEKRWCMINITDKEFSTIVEIWVAPTVN